MKLTSLHLGGAIVPALLEDDRLLPLRSEDSVRTMLAKGNVAATVDAHRAGAQKSDWIVADAAHFAPPIPDPGKFICVGLNYRDHAAEGGHAIPDYPALFLRVATSIVGHGEDLVLPRVSDRFDYEAELTIVIGKRCRHANEDNALEHVFGYSAFNDGSIRDYQKKSAQWTAGKNFDATGALGPAIVSADELAPGAKGLRVTCAVNNTLLQDGNTDEMIFPVARIVAILSEIMTLEPGDIIATGTPAGVGFARKPPVWLKEGDVCTVEIEGVGRLENRVTKEGDSNVR